MMNKIIELDNSSVYMSLNEADGYDYYQLHKTDKLKATSYGNWNFWIGKSNVREVGDRLAFDSYTIGDMIDDVKVIREFTMIDLKSALKQMNIEFFANMNYYLSNLDEIEKDLNRSIHPKELKYSNHKRLELDLFYSQLLELFEESADDNDIIDQRANHRMIMLKNFDLYFIDDESLYATALRGANYYAFHYSNFKADPI